MECLCTKHSVDALGVIVMKDFAFKTRFHGTTNVASADHFDTRFQVQSQPNSASRQQRSEYTRFVIQIFPICHLTNAESLNEQLVH